MNRDAVTAAPAVRDIDKAYEIWRERNFGNFDKFLLFLARPSVDREVFLNKLNDHPDISIERNVILRCY